MVPLLLELPPQSAFPVLWLLRGCLFAGRRPNRPRQSELRIVDIASRIRIRVGSLNSVGSQPSPVSLEREVRIICRTCALNPCLSPLYIGGARQQIRPLLKSSLDEFIDGIYQMVRDAQGVSILHPKL
jgi:hypothetical protein